MASYRKKPVTVQAYQWFKDNPVGDDVIMMENVVKIGDMEFVGLIRTLEDTDQSCHYVCDGDYIVRGNHNDVWAVKQAIFEDTYELVEEPILPDYNN